VLYLIVAPMFASQFVSIYAILVVDAVTMIFWFAGFFAVAAQIFSVSDCKDYSVCRTAQGAAALGGFEW
jgi:occludin/MAL family lipid-associated protein